MFFFSPDTEEVTGLKTDATGASYSTRLSDVGEVGGLWLLYGVDSDGRFLSSKPKQK